MVRKYFFLILLIVSGTAQSLDLWDQDFPWEPLKKEHALFYSATWAAIAGCLGHAIYLMSKMLEKPITSDAIINDTFRLIAMGIFAKCIHHSLTEVVDGLKLYFDQEEQQQVV